MVQTSDAGIRLKLGWLLAGRLIISTVLLGSAAFGEVVSPGVLPSESFFWLIAVTYALSIVYGLTFKAALRHRWLVDAQLALDALSVSIFVYLTGGITSYFSSLYALPIIAASTLQLRRGGLLLATFTSIVYAGLVWSQYFGEANFFTSMWLPHPVMVLPSMRMAGYTICFNLFGFFAVAWLSGSLAEGLQRADARLLRASSEIADWQAFNQHVIDSLTSGLATTDRTGRVLTFNRAAEAITGFRSVSVIGRNMSDVLALPPEFARALERDLDGDRSRRVELNHRLPDGGRIEIGMSATHLVTPGGRAGFLLTFQDVTNLRKLERNALLQQRMAAVGEMAAGIAHEIRNPLAAMSGSIQILRQELPLSPDQAQLIAIVLRESERLNETIRSFLAYARPQRFSIATVDVRRVLTDTALLLRNSAEVHEGHQVDLDVPDEPVTFEADEGQLRQIVWNLATNGLQAMEQGGRLCLIARNEPGRAGDDQARVLLEVEDEGMGIAPEEVEEIFQPFHGNFSRGSGLGLSIVHRIVSDYNGAIQVKSIQGSGTRVTVSLPVRAISAAAS